MKRIFSESASAGRSVVAGTVAVAMTALMAGCASTAANPDLVGAQKELDRAVANPAVATMAPLELEQARRALAQAEQLQEQDADAVAVAHNAYLARQRARIAVETAQLRLAQVQIDQASEARVKILAQARERELQQAQEQLALREREAAQAQALAERRTRELSAVQRQSAEQASKAHEARLRAERLQADLQQMQSELRDMKASQTERGWVLTLGGDVLFESGESELKPGARRSIDNLAGFLRRHPDQNVIIEGYTDSVGGEDFNLGLAQRRARAVTEALVVQGIDSQRIQSRALGEAYPVATNDTAAGRQLNRRVEVVIRQPDQEQTTGASTGGGR